MRKGLHYHINGKIVCETSYVLRSDDPDFYPSRRLAAGAQRREGESNSLHRMATHYAPGRQPTERLTSAHDTSRDRLCGGGAPLVIDNSGDTKAKGGGRKRYGIFPMAKSTGLDYSHL